MIFVHQRRKEKKFLAALAIFITNISARRFLQDISNTDSSQSDLKLGDSLISGIESFERSLLQFEHEKPVFQLLEGHCLQESISSHGGSHFHI